MENTIKNRAEIPEADKWAIEDIYSSDEAWEQDLATLEEDQKILASFAGHLAESGQTLYNFLSQMESVNEKCGLLGNYAMRKSDEDTRDAKYQGFVGKFMSAAVGMNAALSFETPEIMAISDETLDAFYKDCPQLEHFRRYLTDMRRFKEHVLSPAEEKLLAAAGEMAQAPSGIYGMFANADLKFDDALDSEGKKHPISQGTFVACQESSDRTLRKNAYESLYKGFEAFKNTAAGLLNAQNKQLKFFAEARNYESAFEASLDSNNVPTSVYLNLIEAVHENLDKMHRYVSLRKKLLGVDELHFYDVYAPLVSDVDRKIPFAEATQTVYDA